MLKDPSGVATLVQVSRKELPSVAAGWLEGGCSLCWGLGATLSPQVIGGVKSWGGPSVLDVIGPWPSWQSVICPGVVQHEEPALPVQAVLVLLQGPGSAGYGSARIAFSATVRPSS